MLRCPAATRRAGPATHRFQRSTALSSSRPFLADAGSGPANCAGMEETAGAPSSFAALSPRRLRASSRDGGGVVNRPPSPLTMLLSRHTRRREVIAFLAGTGAVAWPPASRAQQNAMPLVGLLSSVPFETRRDQLAGFHRGLNESGFVEGRNVRIEYRWADNRRERLQELAADLKPVPCGSSNTSSRSCDTSIP